MVYENKKVHYNSLKQEDGVQVKGQLRANVSQSSECGEMLWHT